MSDESKLRDQVDRGERARLLRDELKTARQALEKDCFEAFRRSDVHDDNGRTMCRLYLKVLDDVFERFERFIVTGEAAHKEIVSLKDPSRLRRLLNVR